MNILQEFFREGLTITRLEARRLSLRCRAVGERARAGAGEERAGLRPRLRAWAGAGRAAWAGGAGGGGGGEASSSSAGGCGGDGSESVDPSGGSS